jgi:polar amino acid transport system substrate-binding protein
LRKRFRDASRLISKPTVPLLFLVLLATTVACQSGSGGGLIHPANEDSVHRIVESGQLRVGTSGRQPPLNMKDKSGALIGLDVELAQALADAMELELMLIEKPFGQLLSGLENNEFDLVISSMTITPARNARVAFAGPYMISGATLLTREEMIEEVADVNSLDSRDRTWGVLKGSTGEALVRDAFPNAMVITSDDLPSLVPKISAGEIDGIFSDLPYVRFELARHPEDGLAVLPTPFTTEPLGVALPANSPLFANLVQNYLNTLEYTGLLIQMKARWLNGGEWLSEIP